ncbi:DUF3871 family protein [Gramella jeungdoensis]|uniref:DUF3871 family protein n=1 Tax=Gramella jeungdoensis TaxID=708091 RepID=A0ABT0Z1D8_9FLAO|nr:DUF3871 family protein [Gramella jeungdoensis]MCM8569543.1 DUF3871 family protein [Gramella jeungdoensis]
MELQTIENRTEQRNRNEVTELPCTGKLGETSINSTNFIKANTDKVSLSHLEKDCIIPVFAKDNEQTIAHQEFINSALEVVSKHFPNENIDNPEVRVSHMIKGRTPDAIHIPTKDLLPYQKTIYYERMAFSCLIPGITRKIGDHEIALCFGGVRAYNNENLYSKKSLEKFKFFIGFQNLVCCNLCISSDGFAGELKSSSYKELSQKISEVVSQFDMENQYQELSDMRNYYLTESQFAQMLGKMRLYHFLSKKEKANIPKLDLTDNHFSTVAKDYYKDSSFCRDENGDINLWRVYNLFTGANKSSYIDTFLDRGVNAFEIAQGLSKAISGNSDYRWFLS